jgi:hypothetical protein
MDALVGLGLNLHIDYEPFEFLAGIAFAFRNSDADATAARKRHSAQLTKEQKRDAVYKVDVRSRRKAARKQGQGPGQRAGRHLGDGVDTARGGLLLPHDRSRPPFEPGTTRQSAETFG